MPHRTSVIKSRTRMALYLTISVLVIAYLAYFLVYVRGKEQRLDQKGVRTLQSIHNQMREKDAHYFRLIEDADVWDTLIADEQLKGLKDYHENFRDRSLQMLEVKTVDCKRLIVGENRVHLTTSAAIVPQLVFSKKLGKCDWNKVEKIKTLSKAYTCTDGICLNGKVALSDYMKGLDDNEFFEATALIHGKEMNLLYSSPSSALPSSLLRGNVPALSKDSALVGVTLSRATINGIGHRVYALPVSLGDQSAYLVGFARQDEFIQNTRSIGLASALVLALVVLALIAALPLIRIHVINGYERLDNADLVYGVLGLMALAYVGTTICCVLTDKWQKEEATYMQLKEWNKALSDSLLTELNHLQAEKGSGTFFHEQFSSNREGEIYGLKLPSDTPEMAQQLSQILTNIGSRAYHQELMQTYGKAYQWKEKTSRFYLESVYSFDRGCHEAVLSWEEPNKRGPHSIQVITTDLKTLMLAKPPQNFHYVLFNDRKQVLFSSRPSQNNFSQLGEEITPQHFIDRVILTGEEQMEEFEFFLHDYYGFVKPLDVEYEKQDSSHTKPLYLLTYLKQQPMEWQLSNNLMLSGASGLMLLVLLLLIRLAHYVVATRKNKLQYRQRFSYHWFWPTSYMEKGLRYMLLAALGLVVLMVLVLFLGSKLSHVWVTIVVLGATLIFSLLKAILMTNRTAPPSGEQKFVNSRTAFVVLLILWVVGAAILPAVIFYQSASNISAVGYGAYTHEKSLQTRQQASTDFKKKYVHNSSIEYLNENAFDTPIGKGYAFYDGNVGSVKLYWFNGILDFHNRFANTAVGASKPGEDDQSIKFKLISPGLWVGMTILLLLLIQLVYRTTGLVFGRQPEQLNLPKGNADETRREILHLINKYFDTATPPYRHLLLVGAPGAKRSAILNELCVKHKFDFEGGTAIHLNFNNLGLSDASLVPTLFVDSADSPGSFSFDGTPIPVSGLIVIHGLVNDASNIDKLEVKFAALDIFIQKSLGMKFSMCVLSYRKAHQFKELLDHPDLKDTAEYRQRINRCIARWETVMSNFRQFIVPIDTSMWNNAGLKQSFPDWSPDGEKLDVDLTHGFGPLYMAIWGSLTQREKFMVYDLIEDEVVNQFDRMTLQSLTYKGIILFDTKEYRFKPFHSSFGFFVRQNIMPTEIERIYEFNKPMAAWSDVRLSIVLLIAGAFGLVYFMNQDVLTIFSGIVGGVIVAFTSLARIVSSFNFQGLSSLFGRNK